MNIEKYIFRNNKATYYRIKENLKVEYIEPSFVFEMIYFNNNNLLEEELKEVVIEKEKKINRYSNLKIEEIYSRLFRSLINRDKYHSVDLANELYLKDKSKLLELLYKLSYISEDENKLIKTYLFEIMCNKIYNPYILKNVIIYFIKSCPKYIDMENKNNLEYFRKNVSKLYKYVYNKKKDLLKIYNLKELDLETNKEMTKTKKYILSKLESGDCDVRY
ncbi:hypothetical protein [Oceanivirga salmonicida]|uniref:hypothetical protein n=1 Tax=Oceanivirga salmonicida TaxID=1769291 RepID=UPI00083607AA|nr:hypothetical protein [Oceanivirga salmonicida]